MQIKEIRKRIIMMIPYAKRTILSTRMFVLCINILIIAAIVIVTPSLSFQLQTYNNKSTQTNKTQIQVFTVDSKPYGLTYSKWTAKWWQWAYSIPKEVNPSYDDSGKYCSEGQSGPVWFLTSTFKHSVDRYCTIPAGKAILFTILNSECSYAEFPNLKTEKQLRQCSKEMQDSVTHLQASVDGINIGDLDKYRVQSPLFSFTLPKNNILGLPANITTQSASDGNWVFLKPLSVGKHVIYFKGSLRYITNTTTAANNNSGNTSSANFAFAGPYGWDYPTTYHITVSKPSTSSASTIQAAAPSNFKSNNITTVTTIGSPTSTDKTIELRLLADSLENRLNKSAAILELTSKLPEVKSAAHYSNSISPKLHGIPNDVDISKRKIAQSILLSDRDFRVIFFLMPNGNIYLEEPYLLQANLTNNNFAYRDYYKGAINTRNTYLGNVVISNSTGLPTPFISVPIYSSSSSSALTGNNNDNDHNGTLVGIWAGGLNLKVLSKYLQSLNLTNNNNERILYVDQYGHKIADSDRILSNNYNESFANLQAFKNAKAGKSGFTIEEIANGTKRMMILYQPVKFHSTIWTVLLMRQS